MKKRILIAIFCCAVLLGCMHTVDESRDTPPRQFVNAADLTGTSILDTRWKLVELWGKPVTGDERRPFILLHAKEGHVSGFGGCNSISGSYELKPGLRLRFTNIASTMMACPDMGAEQQFFEVLATTDNFACDGKTLSLHKARMAPLARFEAAP